MRKSFLPKVLLMTLLCCFAAVMLSAQTDPTERAKNRAKNRTNQRVDRKVDEGVDRALDKVEGLFRRKDRGAAEEPATDDAGDVPEEASEEQATPGILRGLGQGRDFEPYQNPMRMNLVVDVTTTNQRGKEDKLQMQYTFDTWQTGMQTTTDDGEMLLLLDNKEGYMTIVNEDKDGEKTAMRMRQRTYDFSEVKPDPASYTMRATGNTRVISGYQCSEYIIEHEDGNTTTSWLTKDLDLDYADFARAMASQAGQSRNNLSASQQDFGYEGFPIETTSVSDNGKETTTMLIQEINIGEDIDLSVFDLNGIKVTNLGF